jgi:hemoglobin-like flavoprotein
MDTQTTQLVRSSWQHVERIAPAAAALFYDNLFAADPQLRALFKGDMAVQGQRLMHMIGAAVAGLEEPAKLVPVLQDLARRHVGYGVREAHYDTVGAALLKTLAQGLGDAYTPPVHEAWAEVYGLIKRVMVEAAGDAALTRTSGAAPTLVAQRH